MSLSFKQQMRIVFSVIHRCHQQLSYSMQIAACFKALQFAEIAAGMPLLREW
jgi:hypothetical protein